MYEVSFGLCKSPFTASARVDAFYPAAAIEAARQTLTRCVERAEGAGMVVGPSGTGKTLLCHILAEHFRGKLGIVLLSGGRLGTRRALLQGILHAVGQPYREMDEGELRIALDDYLAGMGSAKGLLLLADDAHHLPSRCLDELRSITNVASDGRPCVRLVLVGAPALEEHLTHPRLDSFNQRIVARCYLEAMSRTETEGYIYSQLAACGGNARAMFPPETCYAVYQATGGVPRLVNQVCDHALMMAHACNQRSVDAARLQEAWADLQQLPTPWNHEATASKERPAGDVIEFGTLDDDGAQPAAEVTPAATPAIPPAAASDAAAPESPAVAEPSPVAASPMPAATAPVEPTEQIQGIQDMLGELEDEFRPAGTIVPEVEIVLDDPGNPFSERFLEEEIVVDRHAAALAERNAQATAAKVEEEKDSGDIGLARSEPETLPLHSVATVAPLEDEGPEIVIDEDYDFIEPVASHPVTPVRRHEYRNLFARLRRA